MCLGDVAASCTNHLPSAERAEAVAAGLASGSGIVRLAALPALAEIEGMDHALARAANDPSAKVRAWTPTVQATPEYRPCHDARCDGRPAGRPETGPGEPVLMSDQT